MSPQGTGMRYQAITLKITDEVSSGSLLKNNFFKITCPPSKLIVLLRSFKISEFQEEVFEQWELIDLLYHIREIFQSIRRQHKEKCQGNCVADKSRIFSSFSSFCFWISGSDVRKWGRSVMGNREKFIRAEHYRKHCWQGHGAVTKWVFLFLILSLQHE